jgi:hypothetical protein
MSMTVATPYRKKVPKPPLEVDTLPMYGLGALPAEPSVQQYDAVFGTTQADPINDPSLYLPAVDDLTFYYYLCPPEFGAVTFKDSTGQIGGWDGASWPVDDVGSEYGPILIHYKGRDWNMYRTDFPGGRGGVTTTTFANG